MNVAQDRGRASQGSWPGSCSSIVQADGFLTPATVSQYAHIADAAGRCVLNLAARKRRVYLILGAGTVTVVEWVTKAMQAILE